MGEDELVVEAGVMGVAGNLAVAAGKRQHHEARAEGDCSGYGAMPSDSLVACKWNEAQRRRGRRAGMIPGEI